MFKYLHKQGIASYIIVITTAIVLLTAISLGVVVATNDDLGDTDSTEIKQRLANVAKNKDTNYEDIRVIQKTETHARGQLLDVNDDTEKSFFAQKISNDWKIISVGEQTPSCEIYKVRGFTEAFLNDCRKTYPDALTVEETKQAIAVSDDPTFLQVVAKVTGVQTVTRVVSNVLTGETNQTNDGQGDTSTNDNTSGGTNGITTTTETITVVTVTSDDGDSIDIEVNDDTSGDTSSIDEGDTVVIAVIAEPNQGGSSGSSSNNNNNSGSSGNNTSGGSSGGNTGGSSGGEVVATDIENVTDEGAGLGENDGNGNNQTSGSGGDTTTEEEQETNSGSGGDTSSGETEENGNNTNSGSGGSGGGVYRLINNEGQEGGLENYFDIDTSNETIKLEG